MAMGTLLKTEDREATLARLRQVRPDTPTGWGKLNAPAMLCHLADQLRVALGDIPSTPRWSFLERTLLKWVVINTGFKPPPGKVQTSPEMLTTSPSTWEADLAACESLMERVGKGEAHAAHPTFGPLNPEEWGRLCWKHMDHHLRQFGV
jgi:hypothetical protein